MSRSTRMFEVIQLLRSATGPITAQAIADELEVNKRTVYRDIASLQAMRIPIDGEAGVGYVMRDGYDLPPLMFDSEELEALQLGLALLGRTGDKALQKTADSVSRKLADAIPDASHVDISDITVFASAWNAIPESEVQPQLIRNCIRDELKIQFHYLDENQSVTKRTVAPLALLYYVDVLVVAAWCDLRNDFRHFRLDRIRDCTVINGSFPESGALLRKRWRAEHDLNRGAQ